eukprot:Protomagalhaensia_sp_Gyna_25__1886@NODE_1_length_10645_cov_612_087781_g0_i0_p1_GENE_NODE_1_length_10645_cov_612_087781_g0_i0NODE_1_length_10645_cov_612_087781_g0_i0_p1_ORF_typecomplete_len788_score118_38MCM/PF00493_23/9_6e95MCM_OB/PF17207_3/2_3e03MCM_OB/PF17207_3/5e29MCM_lid/PF17855_1/7_8e19Mg_chelatase/PF01078_21/4_2e11AAA_3/PF07726_11/1_1e06AAA_3/PF07726_11/1_5e03AAA_3/PF07726_11/1_4e03MCM_N/PF14551_6/1_2e06MCM_N/PF14551_6/8_2e03AAA_5/PF07728_14/7_4e03AAA_5/PF07728_14/1_6e05AAA_5/PF07728_14/3e
MSVDIAQQSSFRPLGSIGHNPSGLASLLSNYDEQEAKLSEFLESFETGKIKRGNSKYLERIEQLQSGSRMIEIEADDVLEYLGFGDEPYSYRPDTTVKARRESKVINTLLTNAPRCIQLLSEAIEKLLKEKRTSSGTTSSDIAAQAEARIAAALSLPTRFRVPYEIHLIPPSYMPPLPIHQLRASHVGSLIKVQGIVAKISTVKPCLHVAVYQCEECGHYEFQQIDAPTFTPMADCASVSCRSARRTGTLTLNMRNSRFLKRQEAKIQELPHLVPPGSVPRQLKVVLYGSLAKTLRPGMAVSISGVYLPLLDKAWRHPKSRDTTDSVLEAHSIQFHTTSVQTDRSTEEEINALIKDTPHLYERLASSIAPAIHGHEDVKKALLLQLVGGSTETFGDGVKIRGDVHVLLMGDPGIAKSQLLLRVCSVAPRAHFTCGKGASGVGLTASVVKDPITGEFSLEGGAIVLADNGVCCIDEFDKMQESDRTAVHEVMEQQTVSISKAGLVATLNARTTILAAANPVFGRYDISRSAVANIGLPAALLSRFDIVFLLLDQAATKEKDVAMAKYLLRVHKEKKIELIETESGQAYKPLTPCQVRAIVNKARKHNPKMSKDLADRVSEQYVQLRTKDREERGSIEESTYTTPRTLFGLLRLSQAVARLRFSETIEMSDFEEALRIMQESKRSLYRARIEQDAERNAVDKTQELLLHLLKDLTTEASQKQRRSSRSSKPQNCWVLLKTAFERAEELELDPVAVEQMIENQVLTGAMLWDGPQKARFMSNEQLETILE